jgi:imidazolonepropionase-like amidohydrolase
LCTLPFASLPEDVALPQGAEEIDGAGRTLMPGLIDAHGHARALGEQLVFAIG